MSGTTMKDQESAGQESVSTGQDSPVEATTQNSENSWNPEELNQLLMEADALAFYIARHGDSLPDNCNELRDELFKAIVAAKSTHSSENWKTLMSTLREGHSLHLQGTRRQRSHNSGHADQKLQPFTVNKKPPNDDRSDSLHPRTDS